MLFRQITHEDLGCASYLVGDESAGVAAASRPCPDTWSAWLCVSRMCSTCTPA